MEGQEKIRVKMLRRVLIAAGAALAIGCALVARRGDVTGEEARRLVGSGARLVDVRTPEEFAERHLPGAVNLPVQDLAHRMGELGSKDQPVVLYCRSGRRSARAARVLRDAGFAAVHDLGAMSYW